MPRLGSGIPCLLLNLAWLRVIVYLCRNTVRFLSIMLLRLLMVSLFDSAVQCHPDHLLDAGSYNPISTWRKTRSTPAAHMTLASFGLVWVRPITQSLVLDERHVVQSANFHPIDFSSAFTRFRLVLLFCDNCQDYSEPSCGAVIRLKIIGAVSFQRSYSGSGCSHRFH